MMTTTDRPIDGGGRQAERSRNFFDLYIRARARPRIIYSNVRADKKDLFFFPCTPPTRDWKEVKLHIFVRILVVGTGGWHEYPGQNSWCILIFILIRFHAHIRVGIRLTWVKTSQGRRRQRRPRHETKRRSDTERRYAHTNRKYNKYCNNTIRATTIVEKYLLSLRGGPRVPAHNAHRRHSLNAHVTWVCTYRPSVTAVVVSGPL